MSLFNEPKREGARICEICGHECKDAFWAIWHYIDYGNESIEYYHYMCADYNVIAKSKNNKSEEV